MAAAGDGEEVAAGADAIGGVAHRPPTAEELEEHVRGEPEHESRVGVARHGAPDERQEQRELRQHEVVVAARPGLPVEQDAVDPKREGLAPKGVADGLGGTQHHERQDP